MKIEPFILEQCYAHGIDAYPKEACGLVSGPIDQEEILLKVHRMSNVMDKYHTLDPKQYPRTNRDGYIIDPEEYLNLEDRLMQQGQKVKVIYHTHIGKDISFSKIDKEYALWNGEPSCPGIHYLVCGINNRQPAGAVLAVFNPTTKDFDIVEVKGNQNIQKKKKDLALWW